MCHVGTKLHSVVNERKWREKRELRTCVCARVCAMGATPVHRAASLCTLQHSRVRARLWSANGRRNCAWITPTARFALSVSFVFVVRSQKNERKKKGKKSDRLAGVIACAALALSSRFVADCISLHVIDARTFVRHLSRCSPRGICHPEEKERK